MGGMYSTSHIDDGIEWFTGNTREASSSEESLSGFPVNHNYLVYHTLLVILLRSNIIVATGIYPIHSSLQIEL